MISGKQKNETQMNSVLCPEFVTFERDFWTNTVIKVLNSSVSHAQDTSAPTGSEMQLYGNTAEM